MNYDLMPVEMSVLYGDVYREVGKTCRTERLRLTTTVSSDISG